MNLHSHDMTGGLERKAPPPLLVLAPVPCAQIRLGSARDPLRAAHVPSVVLAFDLSGLLPAAELRFAALEMTASGDQQEPATGGQRRSATGDQKEPATGGLEESASGGQQESAPSREHESASGEQESASGGWHLAVLTPDRSPPGAGRLRDDSLQAVSWQPRRVPGNPAGWCSVQLPLDALDEGLAAGRVALLLRLPADQATHFVADPRHEHAPRLRLAYDAAGEVAP